MMSDSGKKSAKKLAKPGNSESVKVVVRCRPMSEKETSEGYERIVTAFPERGVIEVTDPKRESEGSPKQFTFDAVYDSNAKQTEMYDETFRPIVDSVLVGFNGTIFAYGQTGAGKTYTMEGIRNDPERKGVIPNSFDHIFNHIARSQNQQYLVTASYLEIYQEEIRDLLSKDHRKCEIKEKPDTGVYVKDLMVYVCKSVKEIEHVMSLGNQNRSVGATNMNIHSSRSHAIFIITVEHTDLGLDGENHIRMGKLNLVDLAGSERQAKTGVAGDRQKESIKINLSLSALGNVISALVDGKSTHIPYRDSKLTRLLQDSLGGNARTIMVANIGPASYNYDETLTTLRYANRAKNIKNRPQVNEDPKEALLKEFQEEIARLKAQLAAKVGKRKKKKDIQEILGNGSEEEELDEGESEEESEEVFLQKQEALLMEEHAAILNDQNLIAEEKEKLLNALLSRQDQLKEEQEARDQLHLKIQAMESKLLSGGKNIIDHTNEQQRELEQRRQELAEQKRLERAIQQKLVLEEETTLEIKETYTSLQQEVEIKTKKLKKLFARLQALKQEIIDIQEINSHERQEQEQIQNELMKQLKLTYLIIENFVPPEEKTKILSRVIYDEDEDLWCFQSRPEGSLLSRRPVATNASRRPVTERAVVIGNFSHHPRYKSDNICLPVLDMPMRTTQDYRYPSVDPLTRAVLDDALKGEEDEDIDVSHSAFNIRPKTSKKPSKSRPESSRSSRSGKDPSSYPQSRGLVPK